MFMFEEVVAAPTQTTVLLQNVMKLDKVDSLFYVDVFVESKISLYT